MGSSDSFYLDYQELPPQLSVWKPIYAYYLSLSFSPLSSIILFHPVTYLPISIKKPVNMS